jgi:hypothetical protein
MFLVVQLSGSLIALVPNLGEDINWLNKNVNLHVKVRKKWPQNQTVSNAVVHGVTQ